MIAWAGAAFLAACAGQDDKDRLRIGFQKNGLLLLARSRGSVDAAFLAEGVATPQWIEFPSGPPMMEAMAAAGVDFGAVGESPPIFAQAAGSPILYFAAQPLSGLGSAILVPRSSRIAGIADLRGHKIAFTKGSSAHLIVAKTLVKAGLTLTDVDPILLSPADAASAFAAGSIDAWSIWDPFLAIAQKRQNARTIITGADLAGSDAFYVGSKTAARDKASQLALLLKALRAEALWAKQNPDAANRVVAEQSGLPLEIVATSLRRGPFAAEPIGADVITRQQANADLFASLGIISRRVDIPASIWRAPVAAQ
jgi:sulfonate transport system substrate-binding protein